MADLSIRFVVDTGCEHKVKDLFMRDKLEPLIDFFSRPKESVVERFSPYFYTYFLAFFADRGRIVRKIREMETLVTRTNAFPGCKLVDVGCGFGLEAIVLSFLLPPDATVAGIDHK